MTAHELLAQVEARGGCITVAHNQSGAAQLRITPRGLVPDLLPEIARFKPALLELLAPDVATAATDAEMARRRVKPEIARRLSDDDVIVVGEMLLLLNAGREIE